MRKLVSATITFLLFITSFPAEATGPYSGDVVKLQITSVGHPYNTVFISQDITDSNCGSTNAHNRFVINSDIHYSTILAAAMAGKPITVYADGVCNAVDIETITSVIVEP